jgi:hypothetical protein
MLDSDLHDKSVLVIGVDEAVGGVDGELKVGSVAEFLQRTGDLWSGNSDLQALN